MMNNKMKVALLLAATMMVGSANVYAANTAGTTKKTTIAVASTQAEKSYADRINELSKKLKPGQFIAYYVADETYNQLDEIYFTSLGFVYSKYTDYLAKAKTMNAPTLKQPSALPKGYKLKTSILYLKSPERTSSQYEKLDQELKAKAANGNKKFVYSETMQSNEASAAVLKFEKGKEQLELVASYIYPAPPVGGVPVPFEKPNEKKETIVINGVECVYTADSKGRDHLDWVDEEQQIRYSIWAEDAKSDVLSFAKGLVGK